jgi:peroxiredoxin
MKKILLMALFTLFGVALPTLAMDKEAALRVGDAMPDFTFKNGLTGQDVSFSADIKGKSEVVALVFFNTGCSACMAEMDEMSKASLELGDNKVRVYGLAVDKRGAQAVKAYNEIYGYHATYLLDPTFSMPPKFGFSFTPASALLDRDGIIRYIKPGFDPIKDSGTPRAEIMKLLK